MNFPLIAPSILAADFANLQRDVEMLNGSKADLLHIDIMDGTFVPNISFGFPVTHSINKYAKKSLDFHLMIEQPARYLEQCKESGAEIISVHYEACPHLHRVLQEIRSLGCKAGVALNPHTPVSVLREIMDMTDIILLMSVNPGFGGQKFIRQTFKKVRDAKELILNAETHTMIEVDGGVNLSNAKELFEAGADILVAGSFVFSSPDPAATILELKDVARKEKVAE